MEDIANLMLEQFRGLRGELQTMRTEMHREFTEVKARLRALESQVSLLKRDQVFAYDADARLGVAIDDLAARVLRIERQLEHTPE